MKMKWFLLPLLLLTTPVQALPEVGSPEWLASAEPKYYQLKHIGYQTEVKKDCVDLSEEGFNEEYRYVTVCSQNGIYTLTPEEVERYNGYASEALWHSVGGRD